MTRTTCRPMKTSGHLTARHPCLALKSSPKEVCVLQMTSHVELTAEQCRVVGARLHREDALHQDPFGRAGLVTSPPTDRARYIWVGDGGEDVPVQQVKDLPGTIAEEPEIARLENLIEQHRELALCPIRLFPCLLFLLVHDPLIHVKTPRLPPPCAAPNYLTSLAVSL
jgi:hypothetical protein